MMKQTIVTFSCSNGIFIYNDDSCVKPMPPYKRHSSIEDAKKYMKENRNIDAKIITLN